MSFINFVKQNLTQLPYSIGKPISMIPYGCRPGISNAYRHRKKEISAAAVLDLKEKKQFIFNRVKEIAVYSKKNVPFYQKLYSELDVQPERFQSFQDLKNLPVITKAELQKVPLEYRSSRLKGRGWSLVNTGGSSGHPLDLYVESDSVGHEWAHMHHIWKQLGFKQSDLRVVFGGRADVRNIVQYDSARHQFNVDLYSGWQSIADRLIEIFNRYSPSYLHGYPSSIFDFVCWLDSNTHPLLPILREKVKGLFLGSEAPSPVLRTSVEGLLDCKSISWYGHTERSVLAYEKGEQGIYYPFITYGFAEALRGNKLICTSYYNHASPLIRYDTGDCIDGAFKDDVLDHFTISDGREGEYVLDKMGNKIFLTGLIFGRHHHLFDLARHVQVHQPRQGQVIVLVTPRSQLTPDDARENFDLSNVHLDFVFKIIEEPIRTKAGKVPLLVKEFNHLSPL